MPRKIEIIENRELIGNGTDEYPTTEVRRYYSPEGQLLASDANDYLNVSEAAMNIIAKNYKPKDTDDGLPEERKTNEET